jgi:hypothetical protein
MSIPLDRLYSFLDGISNHALLIYGWQPHGSKKLQDLMPLKAFTSDWRAQKTQPTLIFHDQEPLDYDFFQQGVEKDLCEAAKDWESYPLISTSKEIQKFYKTLHIRSVTQQSFYDLALLVHSEKNSKQVIKYTQDNFVPVYYWSHAVIAQDWFRFAKHDPLLKIKSGNPKTFLIYNRAWEGSREYRLKFAEQLVDTNLYQNSITSFADVNNNIHYTDYVFKNSKFAIIRSDLEKILPKNTHGSIASADYNNSDYQNSLIEVVLETLFDDQRIHLTEKSLRPIACGQPFILAGTPGSLQYLRDYGFKTFNGYIDETYDTIQDPVERLQAVISEMQRIDSLSVKLKQKLILEVQDAVRHNQQWFFSQQFHQNVTDEFKQNLDQAVSAVKSGPVGNTWKQFKFISQQYYPNAGLQHLLLDDDTIAWTDAWFTAQIKS